MSAAAEQVARSLADLPADEQKAFGDYFGALAAERRAHAAVLRAQSDCERAEVALKEARTLLEGACARLDKVLAANKHQPAGIVR